MNCGLYAVFLGPGFSMTSINTETPRQKQMYLYSGSSLAFGWATQILVALEKSYCTFLI